MVDVISSDMFLLFEAPGTMFDGARMTDECKSRDASKLGRRDYGIAGTIEVGVGNSVWGGPGETRRTKILLKPKVVLETDVVGNGK